MNLREEFKQASGRDVRILIIDSGVDSDHPDLAGHEIGHFKVKHAAGFGTFISEYEGGDKFGHGTAVAYILKQFSPDSRVDSLQVLNENLRTKSEDVVAAMKWGIQQGYDILNCSFGATSKKNISAFKDVLDMAFCKNTWVVSACNNSDFRIHEYPGSFPITLSTDYASLDDMYIKRRSGHLVEFVTNGVDIRVPWKDHRHRTVTGSSFAAPQFAAIAARLRQLHPDWNMIQAKSALYQLSE